MPFCPNCGTDIGDSKFCPNCGASQGPKATDSGASYTSPQQQPQVVKVTSGHQYDETICFFVCCCLSPVAALIYYLLTDHPSQVYRSNQFND